MLSGGQQRLLQPECEPCLAQRPRQLGRAGAGAAHADAALAAAQVGHDHVAQLRPAGLAGRDHRDVTGDHPGQPGQPGLAQRPADRGLQRVLAAEAALALDQHHPVRAAQVVVERLRPRLRALVVGAGQQVVHQVAAQPQLGVGDAAQPGQLHRQHGRAVLQRHQVGAVGLAAGVDEGEHPDHVRPRRGHEHEPFPVPDRLAVAQQPPQQLLALGEGLVRVRVRQARARPRAQVAVPILDHHRHAGELVQGLGYPALALAGHGHPGEPLVDVHAAPQAGHGLGERLVGAGQLGRGGALPGVQPRVGHRHAGLLREHLDDEPRLGRRLLVRRRDQVAEQPADAAQRVGARPRLARQVDRAAAAAERGELPEQAARRRRAAGPPGATGRR